MNLLPGVLVGSGALALLQFAAQCGVEVTKVKQQLQGSILSHGKHFVLAKKKKNTTEKFKKQTLMNENKVNLPFF